MSAPAFSDRLIPALLRGRLLEPLAARAFWRALQLLSLALAHRLSELRSDAEPLVRAHGEVEEKSLIVALLSDVIAILCERLDRIPDRQRPHYSPGARFRILRIKRFFNLSAEETAKLFRVSNGTVERWQSEMNRADDDTRTIGKTVRPSPPLRRYAEVVEHLCQTLALAGLSGQRMIASTLARAGYLVSRSTVRRRLRKPVSVPPPEAPAKNRTRPNMLHTVTARRPNHVWMCDLTVVRGLFGLRMFHVAVILDVFSRLPLVARVYSKAPAGAEMAALLRAACQPQGAPAHFICDHGVQFTSKAFKRTLARKGVMQRFGAVGCPGSIAIIERFWRTVKELLALRFWKPLLAEDLENRLALVLLFYSAHRPHSSLRGATPLEVYARIEPARRSAVRPPLATARDAPTIADFGVRHLDPEKRLPVLDRAA